MRLENGQIAVTQYATEKKIEKKEEEEKATATAIATRPNQTKLNQKHMTNFPHIFN